jgi:AcrR family transcriptional regulator
MALEETPRTAPAALPARERILETAYELFSRDGVRAVGVDRLIDEAGVAKKTFYRHFPSKADLIVAFLDVRRLRWTCDWLQGEMQALGATPRQRLLAIFDAFDEWFHRDDFESCSFIRTLFEVPDPADRIHQEATSQLEFVRKMVEDQASRAAFRDQQAVAYQIHLLMMGAIVSATRGDLDAAQRGRELANWLLENAR